MLWLKGFLFLSFSLRTDSILYYIELWPSICYKSNKLNKYTSKLKRLYVYASGTLVLCISGYKRWGWGGRLQRRSDESLGSFMLMAWSSSSFLIFFFFSIRRAAAFGFLPRAILMTEWSALVISSGRAEHQQPPTQDPPTPPALSFAKTWRKREKGPILVFGWPIELLNISPPLLYMFFFSFLSSQGFSCLLFPRSYIDCVVQTSLIAGWKKTTALYKNLLCIGLYF